MRGEAIQPLKYGCKNGLRERSFPEKGFLGIPTASNPRRRRVFRGSEQCPEALGQPIKDSITISLGRDDFLGSAVDFKTAFLGVDTDLSGAFRCYLPPGIVLPTEATSVI